MSIFQVKEGVRPLANRMVYYGLLFFGGLAFIVLSDYLHAFLLLKINSLPGDWVYTGLLRILSGLVPVAWGSIALGAIGLIARPILRDIWRASFDNKLQSLNDIIEKSLNEIRPEIEKLTHKVDENLSNATNNHLSVLCDKLSVIGDDFDRYIKDRGGPLSASSCRNGSDFERYMQPAVRHLYGNHSLNKLSFYQYVKNRLLDPYCSELLRSNVKKYIKLYNVDKYPDYVMWDEETRYEVRNVVGDGRREVSYDIYFDCSCDIGDLDIHEWLSMFSLVVTFDGREVFDSKKEKPPEKKKDSREYGFFWWQEGGQVNLKCKIPKKVNKERTQIVIREEMLNSRRDRSYSLNVYRPSYRHYVNFQLPREYKFVKNPYFSQEIHFAGLPKRVSDKIEKEKKFAFIFREGKGVKGREVDITINEWILPGIILNLEWEESNYKK